MSYFQFGVERNRRKERAFMFNRSRRKLQKIRRSYFRERRSQHQRLNEEFGKLDSLLKESVIDEDTHGRLKKVLKMGYLQNRAETRLKYGFN